MKFLLVLLALTAVAFADVENNEINLVQEDGSIAVDPQFVLSWEVRHQLRKLQKQMPCGWPNQGIPPLAPYRQEELKLNIRTAIIETLNDVFRFRVDGLDDFVIKKFTLNVIFSRVKFHFIFKKISLSGKYDTNTLLDLLRDLGLSVKYEGKGELDFSLENLSISGNLKYKLPILIGSMKITQFDALVTLGACNSNISGLLGNGKWNRVLNDKIEDLVLSGINENTEAVSAKVEENFVPRVNKMLKGNKFFDVWDLIMNSNPSDTECIPPEDPWA